MLVCALLHNFARETAGAARTRLSLRPLFEESVKKQQTSGALRGESYTHVLKPSLRAKRSNPSFLHCCAMDCFVACAPRNDGEATRTPVQKVSGITINYSSKP